MIVRTKEHLEEMLQFIHDNDMLAYDTETTGLNVRKDKVIGFGVSNATSGYYLPFFIWDKDAQTLQYSDFLAESYNILELLRTKKLLMFNASFDARITESNFKVDLLPHLHADVLLLKHTCDENFPLSLKEIAAKIFGADAKAEQEEMKASIKENGGTATEYYKASLETMGKYCVQDCILTFKLYNHYSKELAAQGLEDFYYKDEVLPLYKEVTIPMESLGVRLDVSKIETALHEIKKDLSDIEASIQEAIAPHLHIFTPWRLNLDYPYKATGRVGKLMKKESLTLEEAQMRLALEDLGGEFMFNLQSKHHLKKLFFDTLGEEPLSRTEPSKTFPEGQPQVDEEFLDKMGAKYPWAADLIIYNKLNKLKSTYMERLLEEQENGRFYASFQQHRTVSGRYSGDMQQLPRPLEANSADDRVVKYTNQIREFIIPDEGHVLCSADYEQLEPSVFAHTSGDPALHRIFRSGLDFYSEVAIKTERLPEVSSDKSAPNYLGKINKVARQKAKAYSLGIAYGMTGYKLQFEIGVDQQTAEELVQDYLNAFPQLANWMQQSKEFACEHGFIRTQTGRIRHMPEAKRLYQMYGAGLEDSLELWKRFNKNPAAYARAKADRKTFKNALNNAINVQVQGLAASIVNRASIAIVRALKNAGLKTRVQIQVHDELVFLVPVSEKDTVSALIKNIMENNTKLEVPLRTEPQFGFNFRECK